MEQLSSRPAGATVVALVGEHSDRSLDALVACGGVDVLSLRSEDPDVATARIRASQAAWVVHDADPLEHVAAAWIELYEERATLGTLEVEVETALDRFDSGRAIMPDYYLVVDPDATSTAWRHWWCGALGCAAPRRVLPTRPPSHPRDDAMRRMLTALPTSRPWPEPASWLPQLPFAIPDRVGLRP